MRQFWAAILLGLPLCAGVRITRDGDRIVAEVDGQPFTALFVGADTRKPYFYPLRSASGKMVTRNHPIEPGKGDSTDHIHQKGLWLAHDNVNGYNFWATEPSQVNARTGRIALEKVVKLKSGKKSGLLRVLFDWKDANGNLLLSEDRRTVIYSDPVLRTMDLDVVLTPAVKVTFGDSTDGFFAMRLAAGLEEPAARLRPAPKRTGRMVNSEGKETEANCWGERAAWIDYFGELEGERLGVAIFDHPSNPRHPTYWQSRGYGLFAANPFCLYHFRYDKWKQGVLPSEPDKSVNADLTIEKGAPLRFRYRVVIHPGDYKSAGIAQRYKAYAAAR
jgi:hypothetical protein